MFACGLQGFARSAKRCRKQFSRAPITSRRLIDNKRYIAPSKACDLPTNANSSSKLVFCGEGGVLRGEEVENA